MPGDHNDKSASIPMPAHIFELYDPKDFNHGDIDSLIDKIEQTLQILKTKEIS